MEFLRRSLRFWTNCFPFCVWFVRQKERQRLQVQYCISLLDSSGLNNGGFIFPQRTRRLELTSCRHWIRSLTILASTFCNFLGVLLTVAIWLLQLQPSHLKQDEGGGGAFWALLCPILARKWSFPDFCPKAVSGFSLMARIGWHPSHPPTLTPHPSYQGGWGVRSRMVQTDLDQSWPITWAGLWLLWTKVGFFQQETGGMDTE